VNYPSARPPAQAFTGNRARWILLGFLALIPALSGCGEVRGALGYNKQAPDEFAVVARAPLSVPPNFQLRPPKLGAERPQEPRKRQGARALVVGRGATTLAASPQAATSGNVEIRRLLGTERANPNIRELVNRETATFIYADEFLIDKILFWKKSSAKGIVVDAKNEKKRLQENAALGKQVTDGETPTIKRKRGGLLDGLF
jgi:hypothetical protein